MVGSNHRASALPKQCFFKLEWRFKVAMIEGEQGQHSGKRTGKSPTMARAKSLKARPQQFRRQSPSPFVEVSEHNAWFGFVRLSEDLLTQKSGRLVATLCEACAQVHIENTKSDTHADFDVRLQHAALLALRLRQVMVAPL